ncbi:MAG: hypothetical protein GY696_13840 [Gammaproteobacteria bacterium]|nr:hypothetical protein [Gammaproteobacteria bacterium]
MDKFAEKITGMTEFGGNVTPLDVIRDKGMSKMVVKALTLAPFPPFFLMLFDSILPTLGV